MAGVDLMLSLALVNALGWTLVHFLWQGCVLAALFWLVCALSRRENAHLRYWAGLSGMFLSLASLLITFAVYYKPAARFAQTSVQSEAINPFLVLSGLLPDTLPLLQQGLEPALPVIVLLWLMGVLIQSVQTFYGWVGIRRLIRSGDVDIGTSLRSVISDLQQLMGVRRPVRVLKSAWVKVPMAAGWLKPVILLPASVLTQLPRDQLEMIIAHELGHIRRYDHLFNLFQVLVETLLFYHPAIAWMSRRVRQERENCCDDLVVARCKKPATYARALANLELMRGHADTLALAAVGGDLLGRIKRIIDYELPRTRSGYVQIIFLSLVAVCVGLGTHQGVLLSQALNQVAGSVRLQASDVEWKTWNLSREVWSAGVQGYAGRVRADRSIDLAVAATTAVSPLPARKSEPIRSRAPLEQAAAAIETSFNTAPVVMPVSTLEVPIPAGEQTAPTAVAETHKPVVTAPTLLSTSVPKYPWRARTRGIEGFVELAFSLDRKGNVVDVEVVDSLPEGIFDQAATKALKRWKFDALSASAKPQRLVQKFDFNLEQRKQPERLARNCTATGRRSCRGFPSNAVVVYVNPPRENEILSRVN